MRFSWTFPISQELGESLTDEELQEMIEEAQRAYSGQDGFQRLLPGCKVLICCETLDAQECGMLCETGSLQVSPYLPAQGLVPKSASKRSVTKLAVKGSGYRLLQSGFW